MPQQTEFAKRTRLSQISSQLTERKLRVAGRVLSYDIETGSAVLVDGTDALFVDVSLALDSISNNWVSDRLSMVMVIGHLEHSEVPLRDLVLSQHPALKINKNLVLRAILVTSTPDLDIRLWHVVLSEEEQCRDELMVASCFIGRTQ